MISQLNSNLKWKKAGQTKGTNTVSLNNIDFSDLLVLGIISGQELLCTPFYIPKVLLHTDNLTKERVFRGGYYIASNDFASMSLAVSVKSVRIYKAYQDGNEVTTISDIYVYYR